MVMLIVLIGMFGQLLFILHDTLLGVNAILTIV